MRFSLACILAFLATFSFLQYVHAAPMYETFADPTRYEGTISFTKNTGGNSIPLVSLKDNSQKTWFCNDAARLWAEGFKVGTRVTFIADDQSAFDVQRVWTSGKISWINDNSVTLTDKAGIHWPCDNGKALVDKGIKLNDKVEFKRRTGSPQTAYDVRKRSK